MARTPRGKLSIFRSGGEDSAERYRKPKIPKNKISVWDYGAAVAQGTHNPLVVGSNPSGPNFYSIKSMVLAIDFLFVREK